MERISCLAWRRSSKLVKLQSCVPVTHGPATVLQLRAGRSCDIRAVELAAMGSVENTIAVDREGLLMAVQRRPADGLERQVRVALRSISDEGRLCAAKPPAYTDASAVEDDPNEALASSDSSPQSRPSIQRPTSQ